MDRITQSMFDAYRREAGLEQIDAAAAFERFVAYCVISTQVSESVNVDDVWCGDGSDTGLDGIAIIVNGSLVTEEEEVDELIAQNGYVDVRFILVQAKRTSGFSSGDISTFLFGCGDFFEDTPRLPRSEVIKSRAELQAYIFGQGARMTKGRPSLSAFYVTTGSWQQDRVLQARIDVGVNDLRGRELFDAVVVTPLGAQGLQDLYRTTQSKVKADFVFENPLVLPEMPGVAEAYLGIVPAAEFLGLIADKTTGALRNVFYDNVRAFQDYNPVNADMRATLGTEAKHRFAILNNGVTVVAKTLRRVGNRFFLEDYQVVNGCQTSHVLYDNRGLIDENVRVPLKIVVVTDDDVTNAVIQATNRQTEVKPQQLYALSEFQKRLEVYFESFLGPQRLYYERRHRQYAGTANIEKIRIVSIQQQLRAFAAAFLELPHRSHYVRSLDSHVGDRIFVDGHQFAPYYACAYALFRLDYLFRARVLGPNLRAARYHLLMVARHLAMPDPLPSMTSREVQRQADGWMRMLWDDAECRAQFSTAAEVVLEAAEGRTLERALTKTQPFTEQVRRSIRTRQTTPVVQGASPHG